MKIRMHEQPYTWSDAAGQAAIHADVAVVALFRHASRWSEASLSLSLNSIRLHEDRSLVKPLKRASLMALSRYLPSPVPSRDLYLFWQEV